LGRHANVHLTAFVVFICACSIF